MRTSILLGLSLFLAACGTSKPDAKEPANEATTTTDESSKPATEDEAVTAAECEAGGGTVAWDIGDGSVQCPGGYFESSKLSGGVEPGLCCKELPDNAE